MLAIVADDLTGALDSAAPFAARGLHTEIALGVEAIADALTVNPDVLSISLGSRDLTEQAARDRAAAAHRALPAGLRLFKKVDSRLKGHIAAELDAVSFRAALVAPAIPSFGRVVRGGHVQGFGVESPIDVRSRLAHHSDRCDVPDTLSDADLNAAFEAARGVDLLIGARSLAEALARQMTGRAQGEPAELSRGASLFVIGSRDPITLAQVEALRAHPRLDHRAAPNGLLPSDSPRSSRPLMLVQAVPGRGAVSGEIVARNLAASVYPSLTAGTRTLLLSGGATAEAVLSRMGANRLRLMGECLPGLGLAYAGETCIIAKSGGFGTPETLAILADRLIGDRS